MIRLQLYPAPAPSFPCSIYQAGPHKYCRGRANNYFLYKRINFNYKEQLAFCNPDNLIASKSSTIIYPCDDHKIYSHMTILSILSVNEMCVGRTVCPDHNYVPQHTMVTTPPLRCTPLCLLCISTDVVTSFGAPVQYFYGGRLI